MILKGLLFGKILLAHEVEFSCLINISYASRPLDRLAAYMLRLANSPLPYY